MDPAAVRALTEATQAPSPEPVENDWEAEPVLKSALNLLEGGPAPKAEVEPEAEPVEEPADEQTLEERPEPVDDTPAPEVDPAPEPEPVDTEPSADWEPLDEDDDDQ